MLFENSGGVLVTTQEIASCSCSALVQFNERFEALMFEVSESGGRTDMLQYQKKKEFGDSNSTVDRFDASNLKIKHESSLCKFRQA